MAKTPSPEMLAHYRETIMTNPDTYRRQLEAAREELRQKGEMFFMNRALSENDEHMPDAEKQMELDRLDTLIASVGARLDWIDDRLADHEDGVEGMMTLTRAERRRAKREANSPEAREERAETLRAATDPLVVAPEEEPEPSSAAPQVEDAAADT